MRVTWKIKKTGPSSYDGHILIPVPPGGVLLPSGRRATKPIALKARAKTPANSLAKAATVANQILQNPALQAILPPGTGTAIKATQFLAKAAANKKLGKALKYVKGPGVKRLGKVLKKFW